MELRHVQQYWETQLELVSALKKDVTPSSLAASVVKTKQAEGVFVVDVKDFFSPNKPKEKGSASTSVNTSSRTFSPSRYTQATQTTLAFSRALPDFDPLQEFHLHLEEEYGGFYWDQMQRIQDTRRNLVHFNRPFD